MSQKVTDFNCEENLQLLRGEVKRLEDKASGLGSTMERQGKEIKQLNEEVNLIGFCLCLVMRNFRTRKDFQFQFQFIEPCSCIVINMNSSVKW